MYKTMIHGAAIALFSAALGFSGSAAAIPGGPGTPCTEANLGEIAAVESYSPRTGYIQRIYECTDFGWSIIARCDDNGCIYY
jgi:hypothetical protein